MKVLRQSALMVVSSAALTSAAFAADLPSWPAPLPAAPLITQEFLSGWYIRGDLGYRMTHFSGGNAFTFPFTDISSTDMATFGGGFGFRAKWFRADVTADYGSPTKFSGATALGSPDVTAKIESVTTLFNGYFDLGSWFGLTPYVGAGAGWSYIKTGNIAALLAPLGTVIDSPPTWRFSWAATAGLSFPISTNLLIDANYRYVDIGSARSDAGIIGKIDYGNLTGQELRVGLRYLID